MRYCGTWQLFRAVLRYWDPPEVPLMNGLFAIEYSEKGSNRRAFEENVISYWLDFLQDVEEGESDVMMPEVLFFFSGCKSIPPPWVSSLASNTISSSHRGKWYIVFSAKRKHLCKCDTCPLFTNNTQLSKKFWLLASISQHSSTTVYCMNSVVFHFSTVCGIWQFFNAVLRYLATFSCGIAVLGPPRSTPHEWVICN